MNCSTPGLPLHHQLPEFTQTRVHRVSDAIQPSHPLSSPSPPAPNLSQHQKIKVGKINILHLFIKNTFLFLAYTKGLSFIYWKLILSYTIIEAIQLCKFWQIEYVTFPQWSRYRTVPSLWNSGKTSVLILEGRIPQGVQDCEAGPEFIGYTVCVGAHLGQKWEVHILRRVWKPVQVRGTQYRQHGL